MTHHHIYPVDRLLALRHYHSTTLSIQPIQRFFHIRSAKVVSCYLAALQPESQATESNAWVLVLKTCNTRMVFIELKEADPHGKTIVVCSERPFTLLNAALQGCCKSWPILTKQDVYVGTWLDRLVESGTTRYLLTKGPAGLNGGELYERTFELR